MEITRDEVRVMTVHGAKGLEAPIVILADTTTPPAGPRSASRGCCRCRPARRRARPTISSGPARKADDVGPVAAARAARSARSRERISAAALCRR